MTKERCTLIPSHPAGHASGSACEVLLHVTNLRLLIPVAILVLVPTLLRGSPVRPGPGPGLGFAATLISFAYRQLLVVLKIEALEIDGWIRIPPRVLDVIHSDLNLY
jgi:hypothetical protein